MHAIKTIPELGAVVAWSPLAAQPNLLCTGTKEGGGGEFSDYGGSLALHRMDLSAATQQSHVVGRCAECAAVVSTTLC